LRYCTKHRNVAGLVPDGVIDIILPAALWPSDSTANRNEYLEYFLGVKAAGAYG